MECQVVMRASRWGRSLVASISWIKGCEREGSIGGAFRIKSLPLTRRRNGLPGDGSWPAPGKRLMCSSYGGIKPTSVAVKSRLVYSMALK